MESVSNRLPDRKRLFAVSGSAPRNKGRSDELSGFAYWAGVRRPSNPGTGDNQAARGVRPAKDAALAWSSAMRLSISSFARWSPTSPL